MPELTDSEMDRYRVLSNRYYGSIPFPGAQLLPTELKEWQNLEEKMKAYQKELSASIGNGASKLDTSLADAGAQSIKEVVTQSSSPTMTAATTDAWSHLPEWKPTTDNLTDSERIRRDELLDLQEKRAPYQTLNKEETAELQALQAKGGGSESGQGEKVETTLTEIRDGIQSLVDKSDGHVTTGMRSEWRKPKKDDDDDKYGLTNQAPSGYDYERVSGDDMMFQYPDTNVKNKPRSESSVDIGSQFKQVVGPITSFTTAIIDAGKATYAYARQQEVEIRRLAEYGPQQAIGIAQLDAGRTLRDVKTAQETGDSAQGLTEGIDRFETAFQPIESLLTNIQNSIGTTLIGIVSNVLEAVSPVVELMQDIYDALPKNPFKEDKPKSASTWEMFDKLEKEDKATRQPKWPQGPVGNSGVM